MVMSLGANNFNLTWLTED